MPDDWKTEYYRRVSKILAPDHYEHGFRVPADHVIVDGTDAYGPNEADISVTVFPSPCPCGEQVRAAANGPEAVAQFVRQIAEETPDV